MLRGVAKLIRDQLLLSRAAESYCLSAYCLRRFALPSPSNRPPLGCWSKRAEDQRST